MRGIARALTARGTQTARGGDWSGVQAGGRHPAAVRAFESPDGFPSTGTLSAPPSPPQNPRHVKPSRWLRHRCVPISEPEPPRSPSGPMPRERVGARRQAHHAAPSARSFHPGPLRNQQLRAAVRAHRWARAGNDCARRCRALCAVYAASRIACKQ